MKITIAPAMAWRGRCSRGKSDADDDGEWPFEVQQERAGDAGDTLEAEEQKDGRDDAASEDHRRHPAHRRAAGVPRRSCGGRTMLAR